jgi:hypothetical protein
LKLVIFPKGSLKVFLGNLVFEQKPLNAFREMEDQTFGGQNLLYIFRQKLEFGFD